MEQEKDELCMNICDFLDDVFLSDSNKENNLIWVKEMDLFHVTNGMLCKDLLPPSRKRRVDS